MYNIFISYVDQTSNMAANAEQFILMKDYEKMN